MNQQIEIWWKKCLLEEKSEAFKYLFQACYSVLYNYGIRLKPNREALVMDAIQETFANIWQYKKGINPNTPALPYLYKCLRNALFNYSASEENIVEMFPGTVFFIEEELMEEGLDDHQKSEIVQILNHLPPRQKEILYLRYYGDLSYEEIAQIIQINYQSVVNQSFRAITSLRQNQSLKKFSKFR